MEDADGNAPEMKVNFAREKKDQQRKQRPPGRGGRQEAATRSTYPSTPRQDHTVAAGSGAFNASSGESSHLPTPNLHVVGFGPKTVRDELYTVFSQFCKIQSLVLKCNGCVASVLLLFLRLPPLPRAHPPPSPLPLPSPLTGGTSRTRS